MTEEQETNWRDELSKKGDYPEKLKILDKETVFFTFKNEGKPYKHPDFKPCIIFNLVLDTGEERAWFVNKENYGVLTQLKNISENLTGIKVKVSRTGATKSNTRYKIEKV